MSPFSTPAAFAPFFRSPVAFRAERPDGSRRGTLMSCITNEGLAEVFADNGTSTKVWQLSLVFRHVDWAAAVGTPPQSGDRFKSPVTRKTFALMEVQSFGSNWSVTAREVPSDNGLL